MDKTINIDNDDFGAILNCAVRYALGRRSYMPGLVISFIRPMLPDITRRTLRVMERDVREFTEAEAARIEDSPAGACSFAYDLAEWENFLGDLEVEMERRDTKGDHENQ